MKLSHRQCLVAAGLIWCVVGVYLTQLGAKLLVAAIDLNTAFLLPLYSSLVPDRSMAVVILFFLAIAIGQLKAKYILSKSVHRMLNRLEKLPEPCSLFEAWGKPYIYLIVAMMGLGMAMRFFSVAPDLRGFIDVAVGLALLQASFSYFRARV